MLKTIEEKLESPISRIASIEAGKIDEKINKRKKVNKKFEIPFARNLESAYEEISQIFGEYGRELDKDLIKNLAINIVDERVESTQSKSYKILYRKLISGRYNFDVK